MGYLPSPYATVGTKMLLEYFDDGTGAGHYPMTVNVVGKGALYDPEGKRVRA